MKKILIFILSFLVISQTSALTIISQDNQNFYQWQGVQTISPIQITIENDNEITKQNSFSLVLPLDANIRFSDDFSWLSIAWPWASKLLPWAIIKPNLRVVNFKVNDDFKIWDNLTISWLKVVIYSKPQWTKWVWIDLNNDGVIDYQSQNWVRVLDTFTYSDTLAPSEVFNLTWSIVDNTITLNADIPWDIDFQGVQIDNLDKNSSVIYSFFRPDINNYSYNLQSGIELIRIRTVDVRANYSVWFTHPISYFQNQETIETIEDVEDPISCAQVITYWTNPVTWECKMYPTPCDVPEGYITSYTWCPTTETEIESYIPSFSIKNRTLLNKFISVIDWFIARNTEINQDVESKNDIMEIRNGIAWELENYDVAKTRLERYRIVKKLAQLIWNLKIAVK